MLGVQRGARITTLGQTYLLYIYIYIYPKGSCTHLGTWGLGNSNFSPGLG